MRFFFHLLWFSFKFSISFFFTFSISSLRFSIFFPICFMCVHNFLEHFYDDCFKNHCPIVLTYVSSWYWHLLLDFFSFKLRFSWFFAWWVIFFFNQSLDKYIRLLCYEILEYKWQNKIPGIHCNVIFQVLKSLISLSFSLYFSIFLCFLYI